VGYLLQHISSNGILINITIVKLFLQVIRFILTSLFAQRSVELVLQHKANEVSEIEYFFQPQFGFPGLVYLK